MNVESIYAADPVSTYTERLETLKKRWLGIFSTRLLCNCGKASISDHATEDNPTARPQAYVVITGFCFSPSRYWQLRNFRPHHSYWCDACGAMYKAEVIEGARGYTPIERTLGEQELHKKLACL